MIDAIVLAAGLSKRMGTDKMALEISGRTILAKALDQAVKSTLNKIIVVTKYSIETYVLEKTCAYQTERIVNIVNSNPEYGMSHSIKIGMNAVTNKANGVMIMLADQVGLDFSIINELVLAAFENPRKIIAPTIKSRRTTPVIFPSILFKDLRQLTGDKGGREILGLKRKILKTIEFGDNYDDQDIDTPEDYSRIMHRLNKG
ncbi:MAG: nucleotidyltransferase family protein [Deltaproteobacteria bacterium]|nr:nucleotidyltransferase family protein [Deltaproteobacteria bacterium]